MNNNVFFDKKIYHIVHINNLTSIINDGYLFCDAIIQTRLTKGTTIGMSKIKKRRLEELRLASHPELHVGDCVPFYFGPRSVMLYLLYRGDHPELDYNGGQEPIIHLVSDMHKTIRWAVENNLKYAFTTSNAGSEYFRDYTNKADLDKINWNAVNTNNWQNCREEKQAEFLIEKCFPWNLIEFIGVYSDIQLQQLSQILDTTEHQPQIAVKREWYY